MAHRPTQRRNPAAPQRNPPPSTTALHRPKSNLSDLITQTSKTSSTVKQFSSLNLGRIHTPPLVDARFHAKSMTSSAIIDSYNSSIIKSKSTNNNNNNHNSNKNRVLSQELEKQSIVSTTKKSAREKLFREKMGKKDIPVEDGAEIAQKARNDDDGDGGKRRNSSVSMGGRRSRSMCGSQLELGDVFAINGVKMVSADMPAFMQIHAVDCARKALDSMENFTSKTLALSLKKEFDGVYGPAWHCIVGNSFGSYVTHSVGGFLYFSMDHKLYILLFKTAVQKVN